MIGYDKGLAFQRHLWDERLAQANCVVDCTCGKGLDLEYLCERSPQAARIYAIDKQACALDLARERVRDDRVTWLEGSHDEVLGSGAVEGPVDLAVFNLGYLPTGDHNIVTEASSTIGALRHLIDNLAPRGLITVLAYPGTDSGAREEEALQAFLEGLDQKVVTAGRWQILNQVNRPPVLYVIAKR